MGRKDLLKGLMDEAAPKSPAPRAKKRAPKGAIGAVSESIAELRSRAVVELDPALIDAAGVADRLEHDETAQAALEASLREYGQQVPILVRPHPTEDGRYEIVYGRRRLAALRAIGAAAKAMVRDLDDREAVLAQGQENSARRDLSFIEKVNFARQMRDAGYDRKTICDALDVDKTLISRMLSVADLVPAEAIAAVGAAPAYGRDRWIALAKLIERRGWEVEALVGVAVGADSNARFEALQKALTLPDRRKADAAKPAPEPLKAAGGRTIGEVRRARGRVVLTFKEKDAAGFERWLVENMSEIHRDWMNRRGE
ncbi:MAG: plasmid partitioning protein RepB [Pseudomonadota bacterium]